MNFFVPITPATTEPVWMPMRIVRSVPVRARVVARSPAIMSSAMCAIATRVIGDRLRDAGDDHVRVADRLDLLEAVLLGEPVERAEQLVRASSPAASGGVRDDSVGEPDDVGEQHRDRLEPIDDQALAGLQPVGDRRRAAR